MIDNKNKFEQKPDSYGDNSRKRKSRKRTIAKNSSHKTNLKRIVDFSAVNLISDNTVEIIITHLKLKLSDKQRALLVQYLLLVKQFNQDINLVSRLSIDEVLITSLWESLCTLNFSKLFKIPDHCLLDLGTGGGFPGIPIAISTPELKVTLLDSRRVKVLALQAIVKELQLSNTNVIYDRAEILKDHDEQRYDLITARSVGALKEVAPWSSDLLKPQGKLLIWKGAEGLREYNSLSRNDWKLVDQLPVQPHRNILVLEYKG
ncbi:MAG: 16S rRNA (guanine(527)-N(7))-methyltransferase RsmG [Candidatus Electryonea clarkiae]|nr:16S rRNA (guanine(527)-N(7))-methyltransferase RsmG [Candidatus Electryonea clarkiae]MDP8288961.1 16S rRNA (guanine(527)-N(7))-methyltransferase RsmG [Candidatus Electryonea clarkiae]